MASENEAAVLAALKGAPYMHNRQIQLAAGLRRIQSANSIIGRLLDRGEIVCVGRARDAGLVDVPRNTKLYALTGTPPLEGATPPPTAAPRKASKSGSGVIAGPITHGRGSFWGAGPA